jgi:hypothetical protein
VTPPKRTTVFLTSFPFAAQVIRCDACGQGIKLSRRIGKHPKGRYILINIRHKGRWIRMERQHVACYQAAGNPYGEPVERAPRLVVPNGLRSKAVKDFLAKSG